MRFSDIEAARKLLGIGETASIEHIKSAYRAMAHQYHPDMQENKDDGVMKEINHAYQLLMDVCKNYRYSFRKEDISRIYQLEEDLDTWRDKWAI